MLHRPPCARLLESTHDTAAFGERMARAMHTILETFRQQQRKSPAARIISSASYAYAHRYRAACGYGNPARPIGLIYSIFRPSDDSCIYPLFIPGKSLRRRQPAPARGDGRRRA